MRTFQKLMACGCLLAFGLVVTADDKKAGGKDNAAKLEGMYTIVSGEEEGKTVPAEHIKGSLVRITKDEIIGTDKDKKQIFVAKYTLDTSAKPWKIMMKTTAPKEGDANGLVKKEGDTVSVIYALPGGKDPTEFKTGAHQNMFVLKKMAKGGGTKPSDK